jgi:hypothetical protein
MEDGVGDVEVLGVKLDVVVESFFRIDTNANYKDIVDPIFPFDFIRSHFETLRKSEEPSFLKSIS